MLPPSVQPPLTIESIRAAHDRIRDKIHRTPILTSRSLDELYGLNLFFKCENLQKAGSFKARGATNAVFSLGDDEAARGVATHSSGNHAAALARAAQLRGIPAHIVMPNNSTKVKQAAVRRYGGQIVFCEPTQTAREAACAQLVKATGATLIHPYNDYRIMAGQGTAALELMEQVPGLDLVMTPVGGGGLLAGTSVAVKCLESRIQVIGVEPEQADDACLSLRAGKLLTGSTPNTIADGLRVGVGFLNFPVIQANVDDIVTVSESGIVAAMQQIWEVLKTIIEPSSAVPFAAVLERKLPPSCRRIGIVLSGGNVDVASLPWNQKP
jgi:threonine dehydratase